MTLPAAASLVGGAPFYSDVRVFNTSYGSPLSVTATYRCFIATLACPVVPPQIQFTLAPRESKAFNDICAVAFHAPDTAGGVEFQFDGEEGQLVVTSRLYSTSPYDSVGMFIPGLDESKAAATTVLSSIRHDPGQTPPSGFRTNVGLFNPGSFSVSATFTIFADGVQAGVSVIRNVAGHSGVQVSGIFEAAGVAGLSTQNAVIVVSAAGPVFSYAAVIDNATTDPIFVVGAPNQGPAAGTPTPTLSGPTRTRTPSQPPGSPTVTSTPGGPTPTKTATGPAPTVTSTPTLGPPTPTATITRTPTISQTPTITRTPTISQTPTMTFTATQTFTITQTATKTQTATVTQTPTKTLTPPPSQTPTRTLTPTQTFTASRTPTVTQTATKTQTFTLTPTAAATATRTPTITPTPNPNHIVIGRGRRRIPVRRLRSAAPTSRRSTPERRWSGTGPARPSTPRPRAPAIRRAGHQMAYGIPGQCSTRLLTRFTFTFTAADSGKTFDYYCRAHGDSMGMRGTVSVLP